MEKVRLNKYLASCGVASRRAAEKLMEAGKVKVNGIIIREMGFSIDPKNDKVVVGELQVQPREEMVYYMLNKPRGYVTTSFDPLMRKKAIDLVPSAQRSAKGSCADQSPGRMSQNCPRVFSVGRLDYDTSGLLILTNDGDLTYRMTHPKFEKSKTYEVVVSANNEAQKSKIKSQNLGVPSAQYIVESFEEGIEMQEGTAKADKIKIISEKGGEIVFQITLHQGWNRQIRRMCEAVGLNVVELKRLRIDSLELGELKEGEWRNLTEKEVEKIKK